jgi:hypothetical protein
MTIDYWDADHPIRIQEQKFIRGEMLSADEILRIPVDDYRAKRLRDILSGLALGDVNVTADPQARDLLRRRNECLWDRLLKNAL